MRPFRNGLLKCCALAAACMPLRAAPNVSALPNGFRTVVSDEPGVNRVAVLLMVRAGDADDPPEAPGAARILGRLLIEPANHRASARFPAMDVEGGVRVETEHDVTTFSAVTTPDNAPTAIALIAACVAPPVWNNTTLIAAVKRNGEEDREEVPTEWERDFEVWQSRLGFAVAPPAPALPPRETLQGLFETLYQAHSMTLAVVGDLRDLNVKDLAMRKFGGLPRTADTVVKRRRRRDAVILEPTGVYAFAGYEAPPATSPMAPAMEVVAAAMGLGKTSAVFQILRDAEGTGYESGVVYPKNLDASGLALYARAPGKAAQIRDALKAIWKSAALEVRTDWGSARARAVQSYAAKHQTTRDRAYWLAFWETAGKGAAFDAAYPDAIRNTSNADLLTAIGKWLTGPPMLVP